MPFDHNFDRAPRMNEDELPFFDLHDQRAFLLMKLGESLSHAGYRPETLQITTLGEFLLVECTHKKGQTTRLATLPSALEHLDVSNVPLEEKWRRTSNLKAANLASVIKRNLAKEKRTSGIGARVRAWFVGNVVQTETASRIKVIDEFLHDPLLERAYEEGDLRVSNMEELVRPEETLTIHKIRFGLEEDDVAHALELVKQYVQMAKHTGQRVYLEEKADAIFVRLSIHLTSVTSQETYLNDFYEGEDEVY